MTVGRCCYEDTLDTDVPLVGEMLDELIEVGEASHAGASQLHPHLLTWLNHTGHGGNIGTLQSREVRQPYATSPDEGDAKALGPITPARFVACVIRPGTDHRGDASVRPPPLCVGGWLDGSAHLPTRRTRERGNASQELSCVT